MTNPPHGSGDWLSILDAYERALADTREHLTDGTAFTFAFPDGLGPVPQELLPRASELLEFAKAVEHGVAAAMTKVQAELAATAHTVRARGSSDRPAPRYIDTTG